MAVTDWNWLLEADRQDYPWDCAACSLAWCLRAIGRDVSEQDVIAGLGPGRISPTLGLLNASGAGLVDYLAEQGVVADYTSLAIWQDLQDAAGYQPMLIGGRRWNHWVAVRMGSQTAGREPPDELALMNPSPGYRGVWGTLAEADFDDLGTFSAVWFAGWQTESP